MMAGLTVVGVFTLYAIADATHKIDNGLEITMASGLPAPDHLAFMPPAKPRAPSSIPTSGTSIAMQ